MNEFLDKVRIFQNRDTYWWERKDVVANKNCLFVYGDNDIQKGKGGQAMIRDFPNTIGIPTKKLPRQIPGAYYIDDEFDENVEKITIAFEKVILKSKNYKIVYFPKDGFKTGLASMDKYCPRTLAAMNKLLSCIYDKENIY